MQLKTAPDLVRIQSTVYVESKQTFESLFNSLKKNQSEKII